MGIHQVFDVKSNFGFFCLTPKWNVLLKKIEINPFSEQVTYLIWGSSV